MSAEPLVARVDGDLLEGHRDAIELRRRPTGEVDVDGIVHLAAAESRARPTTNQQCLVDVVMLDDAEALEVEGRERDAEGLGESVTDRIGVAETLSLDQLDAAPGQRLRRRLLDQHPHPCLISRLTKCDLRNTVNDPTLESAPPVLIAINARWRGSEEGSDAQPAGEVSWEPLAGR